jgi:hypothetical protein
MLERHIAKGIGNREVIEMAKKKNEKELVEPFLQEFLFLFPNIFFCY